MSVPPRNYRISTKFRGGTLLIIFLLVDAPLAQVQVATHVDKLGQCRGHVVLQIHLVEVDPFRTCSQISKPYSYAYMK